MFNRDLRTADHPALAAACRSSESVVPLFVIDPALTAGAGPNRVRFLVESLHALRTGLRDRGGNLVVRTGEPVDAAMQIANEVGAERIFASRDVSMHAQRREQRLDAACRASGRELALHPGVTVVDAGDLRPSGGGDHFRVFTPYWRKWLATPWRAIVRAPARVAMPSRITVGRIPRVDDLTDRECSPECDIPGGERAAHQRLSTWLDAPSDSPWDTSRLSAYLKFGCISPLQVAREVEASGWSGSDDFVRSLCWRDFFHQVVAAFPAMTTHDYRSNRKVRWRNDPEGFAAWCEGATGVPLVDAGMRQLLREGWMPGRARLVAASYLSKSLRIDWRLGAAHFSEWLVDGDVPCNYGNWQWAAGTGNDTRPNRVLNPERQAARFDPDGSYVEQWTA